MANIEFRVPYSQRYLVLGLVVVLSSIRTFDSENEIRPEIESVILVPELSIFSERELKFMFAICLRLSSVCHLSSVVCLSVTFVRPTQAIEIFRTFSSPFGTLAIC